MWRLAASACSGDTSALIRARKTAIPIGIQAVHSAAFPAQPVRKRMMPALHASEIVIWKERLDPGRHRDIMSGAQDAAASPSRS